MSEEKKPTFGITTETKASNNAPLLVATRIENDAQFPSGWKFPVANLVNVISNNEYEKKDGNKVPVLQFIFRDADKRQHMHTEWEVEADDTKFQEKKDGLDVRIAHIYTAIFGKVPAEGIGTDATSWGDYFNKVAHAFNSKVTTKGEGEEAVKTKYYPTVSLYYKLTFYKTRMNFPLSPNFLEKAIKDKPCKLLAINTTYDKLVPTGAAKSSGIPGMGTSGASEDLPSFDEEYK